MPHSSTVCLIPCWYTTRITQTVNGHVYRSQQSLDWCVVICSLYGWGHNEELLGQIIKDRRDKFVIASKCGFVKG